MSLMAQSSSRLWFSVFVILLNCLWAFDGQAQINSATWVGGSSGNFSDPNNWSCSPVDITEPKIPCTPNGINTADIRGATVNVDINVSEGVGLFGAGGALILNGTSVTAPIVGPMSSTQLSNGASIHIANNGLVSG